MNETIQFNALTDAWLPLLQEDESTTWASPVEVLCGEKDGIDLDYPRDDFRVYARLLLSALVQALFAAKTNDELVDQLVGLKKEQFNLRFQRATQQLEAPARVRTVRREIAVIKTILGEKKSAEAKAK